MTTLTPSAGRTRRSLTYAAIYLGIGIALFLGLSSSGLVDRLNAVNDKLAPAIFLLMLTAFGLTALALGRWVWRLGTPQPDLSPFDLHKAVFNRSGTGRAIAGGASKAMGRALLAQNQTQEQTRIRTLIWQVAPQSPQSLIETVYAHTTDSSTDDEIRDYARRIAGDYQNITLGQQRICDHESAHALVAHLIGTTVTALSKRPRQGYYNEGGYVEFVHDNSLPIEDITYRKAHAIAAGLAWDHICGIHDDASSSDVQSINHVLAELMSIGRQPAGYHGAMSTDELRLTIMRQTTAILEHHTMSLKAISAWLDEHSLDTLTGRDFHALVIELNLDQPSRFVERLFTDTPS